MRGPELSLFWEKWQAKIHPEAFRGHDQFLSDVGYDHARMLSAVRQIDRFDLLSKLTEDTAFGCQAVEIDGLTVSRDLLDSILELYFLVDNLPSGLLADLRVLDIGAGYGRFAHRAVTAFPRWTVSSTDAVPVATACAQKYLRFRGVQATRAPVVPLADLDKVGTIDLAVNIHSWSECTYDAVQFWVDFALSRGAEFIFTIPHTGAFMTDDGKRFSDIISGSFELAAKRQGHPPYPVSPTVPSGRDYYLFRRRGA